MEINRKLEGDRFILNPATSEAVVVDSVTTCQDELKDLRISNRFEFGNSLHWRSSMNTVINSEEEQKLIDCILQGESERFQMLVDAYQNRIFRGAYAILGNEQDAEDVTQETFLTAFRKLNQFQHRSSFFTWLYRISYNLAIDVQRRTVRTRQRLGNQYGDDDCTESQGCDAAPDQALLAQETTQQVRLALAKLDAERRSIIVMRDIDGLDYSEIANILDLPIGTVRSRLHRARLELREIMIRMGMGVESSRSRDVDMRFREPSTRQSRGS